MLILFVMQVYRGFKFLAECISCLPFLLFIGRGYVSRRFLILANNICWGLMLQLVNFDAHSVILTALTWLCGFYSYTLLCLPCCCVRFRLMEAAVC